MSLGFFLGFLLHVPIVSWFSSKVLSCVLKKFLILSLGFFPWFSSGSQRAHPVESWFLSEVLLNDSRETVFLRFGSSQMLDLLGRFSC